MSKVHLAARDGNIDEIREQLLIDPSSLEAIANGFYFKGTPLHWACYFGQRDAALELILQGANVNSTGSNNDLTPMHVAVVGGDYDLVLALLIEKEANVSCRSADGKTPEDLARKFHRQKCIRLLEGQMSNGEIVHGMKFLRLVQRDAKVADSNAKDHGFTSSVNQLVEDGTNNKGHLNTQAGAAAIWTQYRLLALEVGFEERLQRKDHLDALVTSKAAELREFETGSCGALEQAREQLIAERKELAHLKELVAQREQSIAHLEQQVTAAQETAASLETEAQQLAQQRDHVKQELHLVECKLRESQRLGQELDSRVASKNLEDISEQELQCAMEYVGLSSAKAQRVITKLQEVVADRKQGSVASHLSQFKNAMIVNCFPDLCLHERKTLQWVLHKLRTNQPLHTLADIEWWTLKDVARFLTTQDCPSPLIDKILQLKILGFMLLWVDAVDYEEMGLSMLEQLKMQEVVGALRSKFASLVRSHEPQQSATEATQHASSDHAEAIKAMELQLEVLSKQRVALRHKLDSLGLKIPSHLVCPITLELMSDPVVTCDGHCYERLAIELWFAQGGRLSPKTGAPLETTSVTPAHLARAAILEFLEQSGADF